MASCYATTGQFALNRNVTTFGVLFLAAMTALVCGLILAPQALFVVFVILSSLILATLWPWVTILGVSGTLQFEQRRVSEGEEASAFITIANRWPWPVWCMTIGSHHRMSSISDDEISTAVQHVPGRSCVTLSKTFRPACRGVYPKRPLHISTSFPFGLWSRFCPIRNESRLIVWPRTFALPVVPLSNCRQQASAQITNVVAGTEGDRLDTRPYRHGDSLRLVNWRKSAQLDRFMSWDRQSATRQNITVSVDYLRCEPGDHGPQSSFEWSLRIAASVCQSLLNQGCGVTLRLSGRDSVAEPLTRDNARLFDWIALFDTDYITARPAPPIRTRTGGSSLTLVIQPGTAQTANINEPHIILFPALTPRHRQNLSDTPHRIVPTLVIASPHDIPGQMSKKWHPFIREVQSGR